MSFVENQIFYSSAGLTELLIAVPEPKAGLLGAYSWQLPETAGIKVSTVGTFQAPNPTATFDQIKVLKFQLTGQAGVQPFNMIQETTHPPFPLLFGRASMISHPVATTYFVHAQLPVGGIEKAPLMVAVNDQSGSTGYHWEVQGQHGLGLQVSSQVYQPQIMAPGAPSTRIFFVNVVEPGNAGLQLQLIPPGGKAPASTIVVSFAAIA
jgi:predicted secreted protein